MKPFQTYIFELSKPSEFRIKVGNVDPKGYMDRIKDALNAWQLESISPVKSLPIQEHREFPQWGPCESWTFDVKLAYPTNTVQVRRVITERAGLNPDWICVRNLNEANDTDEAEARGKDHKGALLDDPELKEDPEGQPLVGQARIGSLLKELESRKFDVAGTESADGKTTNEIPQGDVSPVGTVKNKLQGKRGQ